MHRIYFSDFPGFPWFPELVGTLWTIIQLLYFFLDYEVGQGQPLRIIKTSRPLVKRVYKKIIFLFLSQNINVVGTQKNRLNETVLLSTQNIC